MKYYVKFISKVLFCCLLSFVAVNRSIAATDPSIVKTFEGKDGAIKVDSIRETVDLIYENTVTRARINLNKPQFYTNAINLLVDELSTFYIQTDFSISVTFDVQYTNISGNVVNLNNQILTVNYTKAEGAKYDARQYLHFKDGRSVKVTIKAVNNYGATWDVTKVIRLENRMDITRDYNFSSTETVTGVIHDGSNNTIDELKVNWNINATSGLTHYEVEWSWADANVISRYLSGSNYNTDLIFTDNSTRVTVINLFPPGQTPNYRIPMMYDGEGYLFFRIRPVQYLVSGKIVIGAWSTSTGTSIPVSNVTYFIFGGHETNLNWRASTSYAEEGKRKTVIQYLDGTLRGRQTVTKDNITNTTVIAETFYDYQGRPAIQVLPAPTLNTIIQYAQNFNNFQTNLTNPYQKDIYDLVQPNSSICNTLTPPLQTSIGASQYYSVNNPQKNDGENKFIPDAQGYPYTETRYSQDGTGRIAAQSGLGITHQLGTGKETQYYYGSASQKELDALFGTEVGDASHYSKNMVRDANGQYSVSYVDMTGKTIATALAGNPPATLSGLDSHAALQTSQVTESLISSQNNIVQGRNIVASKTLLVPKAGPYRFNYNLSPQSAEIIACNPSGQNVCYDCLYNLEIRITGSCGEVPIIITRRNFSLNSSGQIDTLDINCTNPSPIFSIDTTINFTEGEYNVTKTLSLSGEAQDWYKEHLFRIKNICRTLQNFYDSTYQVMLAESNCEPTCATCTTALGTYPQFRARFLLELGISNPAPQIEVEIQAAYDQNAAQCNELCQEPFSKLASIKMQMLQDMTPANGQYARQDWIAKPFSIYNTNAVKYKYPLNEMSQPDYFRDNLKQVDTTAHVGGAQNILNFSSPDDFDSLFVDTWANSLLPHHPEYGKYKAAVDNLIPSYQFDEQLERTETFAAANASATNYINNILNLDPFFSLPGTSTYKTRMLNKITQEYKRITDGNGNVTIYNMWQVAWMSINCLDYSPMNPSCANSAPSGPPFVLSSCTGDWNKVWQIFRTIYLSEKHDLVDEYLNVKSPPNPSTLYNILSQNDYQRRFGTMTDMFGGGYLSSLIAQATYASAPQTESGPGTAQDSIRASYNATCEGYRTLWMQDLANCDQINNLNPVARENLLKLITDALKDVCIRGSDIYHMLGSASEIPGDPRAYDDFEETIKTIFTQYGITTTTLCHPYLISYPRKYTTQAPLSEGSGVIQKDTCICNRLTDLRVKKTSDGFVGTLSQFVQYRYGVAISQGLLDTLSNGCNGTPNCITYDPTLKIPGLLTCYSATETCISCGEYDNYVDSFHVKFPMLNAVPYEIPADSNEVNANLVFEQYMNYQTGFSKNWTDYVQFGKACQNYNTGYDCNYLDSLVAAFKLQYSDTIYGVNCQQLFVQFFNQATGGFYTWQDIQNIFMQSCGHLPDVCSPILTCAKFNIVIDSFLVWYDSIGAPAECTVFFTNYFNQHFGTNYTWAQLQDMYHTLCGGTLDVCDPINCRSLNIVLIEFDDLYDGMAWLYPDCEARFVAFFNTFFHTTLNFYQISELFANCGSPLNICNPPIDCNTLDGYINSFKNNSNCTNVIGSPITLCQMCFRDYINNLLQSNYSYEQIALMYLKICDKTLNVCEGNFNCEALTEFYNNFTATYTGTQANCRQAFTAAFNAAFLDSNSNIIYTFPQIEAIYILYCGTMPAICTVVQIQSCDQITTIYQEFIGLYPDPAGYFGDSCQSAFAAFFNTAMGSQFTYQEIVPYYQSLCGSMPNVCMPQSCPDLQSLLASFITNFGSYNLPQALNKDLFLYLFNQQFQPGQDHYWSDIVRIYQNCGITLTIAPPDNGILLTCSKVNGLKEAFYAFNSGALPGNCVEVFTNFFNLYYDQQMSYQQIVSWATVNCNIDLDVCGATSDGSGSTDDQIALVADGGFSPPPTTILPPRLCGLNRPLYPPVIEDTTSHCSFIRTLALNSATEQYNLYLQQQLNNFDIKYQNKCLEAKNLEEFTVSYVPAEYHYTLFYYDQAGNLVKTVPPAGAKPDFTSTFLQLVETARTNGTIKTPDHTLATQYRYNTLGQVTALLTPDAGLSKFWYDRLGRLAVSQNSKQKLQNKYSYTLYDQLGRIVEVGEKPKELSAEIMSQTISQNITSLNSWINTTSTNEVKLQLTRTLYDEAYAPFCQNGSSQNILCQKNLRNRVSFTYVKATESSDINYTWDAATFYSYDIHGNIDTLLQDYKTGMGSIACTNDPSLRGNRFKKMIYNYDLVSGKVNEVAYQAGLADQFYYRYSYDAENRPILVETSRDRIYWEKDATYNYYKHGPLARTILGTNQVQGLDYAYTLLGSLKGVNSTTVGDGTYDMGQDGKIGSGNSLIARDVYSFSLNYFNGDYIPINTNFSAFGVVSNSLPMLADNLHTGEDLFNGNIRAMHVNIPKLGEAKLYGYKYDQLNRIIAMNTFSGITNSTNTTINPSVATDDFKERISYDANGNIVSYSRNGTGANGGQGLAMDNLSYNYDYYTSLGSRGTYIPGQTSSLPSGSRLTNQLNYVIDVAGGAYTEDIKSQNINNYSYDAIGNLIQDQAEGLYDPNDPTKPMVEWNLYGKISKITKIKNGVATVILYSYDAWGNRISKDVNGNVTFYVRDVSGNVMSLYQKGESTINNGALSQTEVYLYGTSRLGVYNVKVDVQNCLNNIEPITTFTRGNKFFELSNHLGNVLVTVSDKKIQHTSDNTIIDYYTSDVITANDYYPGGMIMSARKYQQGNNKYRYGFNGQEKEIELNENITSAEYWEYDSRIGRRWNIDPKTTADESPYATNNNNPILMSDPDGDFPGLGFLAGMFVEILIQTVEIRLGVRKNYDPGEIFISGLMTQAGMGVAKQISRIKTLSKLGKAAVEVAGDVVVNSAEQYAKSGDVKLADAFFNAFVSRRISKAVEKHIVNTRSYTTLQNKAKNAARYNKNNPKPSRAAEAQRTKKAVEGYVALRSIPATVTGTSVASKVKDGVQTSLSNEPTKTNTKAEDTDAATNNTNQVTPQGKQETKSELVARYNLLRQEDYNMYGRIRKTWTDSAGKTHSSDEHNPNYKIPKRLDKNY